MTDQERQPGGPGIGSYVKPPQGTYAFQCRCGRRVAWVDYRRPDVARWGTYRADTHYCDGCGTRLTSYMANEFWLADMVLWARAKKRGVRFLGLKEHEAREAANDRFDRMERRESCYRPTPEEFLEGGH
jgi:hypothetical protein